MKLSKKGIFSVLPLIFFHQVSQAELADLSAGEFIELNSSTQDTIETQFTINNHLTFIDNHSVLLSFSTGKDINTAATLSSSYITDVIPPGESLQISKSFNRLSLSDNLYVTIDPYNDIHESNENNNTATIDLTAKETKSLIELEYSLILSKNELLSGESLRAETSIDNIQAQDSYSATIQISSHNTSMLFDSGLINFTDIDHLTTKIQTLISTQGWPIGIYTVVANIYSDKNQHLKKLSAQFNLIKSDTNQAPITVSDSTSTVMNQSVGLDLALNDYDPDGDLMAYHLLEQPSHATVSINTSVIEYVPEQGFVGADTFSVQVNDSQGASSWSDVQVNVYPLEEGCTWVRDYSIINPNAKIAEKSWAKFPEQGLERPDYMIQVLSNDNPDLFIKEPYISYPSCSLYFSPQPDTYGTTTVSYVVQDSLTKGDNYQSDVRTFDISLKPKSASLNIISTAKTIANINADYNYDLELDSNDSEITITALELPNFLSLEVNQLQGTPTLNDLGMHRVSLQVDSKDQSVTQSFLLTVQKGQYEESIPTDEVFFEDEQSYNKIETNGGVFGLYFILLSMLGLLAKRQD